LEKQGYVDISFQDALVLMLRFWLFTSALFNRCARWTL